MSLTSKQIEELRTYAKDRKGELAKLINDAADTIEMLSEQSHRMKFVQQSVNTIMSTSRSYSIRDRAFRNAARLVQCAIDGEAPDFEQIPEGDEMLSEPKWIPTSKKPDPDLPEDDMSGYFLVTLHTYGDIGFNMDEYKVEKMRWNRVNGWVLPVHSPEWIEEALTQDVLAWKPWPEPYREDGAE